MSNKIKCIIFIVIMVITGCSTQSSFVRYGDKIYPPKPDKYNIKILKNIDKTYTEVGIVTAQKEGTTVFETITVEQLLPTLKAKARQFGADAIINLKTEEYTPGRKVNALNATGTAIIFNNK